MQENGSCRFGDKCRFNHDYGDGPAPDIGEFGYHANTPGVDVLMSADSDCEKELSKVVVAALVAKVRSRNGPSTSLGCYKEEERVIDRQACAALRSLVDDAWKISRDAIDDFKLQISVELLSNTIGQSNGAQVCKLMDGDFDKILLRRSEPRGHVINFHLDYSRRTLQVPLVDEDEYSGGRLLFALEDGTLLAPKRLAGSATRHDNTIVHGVTKHTAGVRYGLFLLKV